MVGTAVEIVAPGLMVPFEAYHELVKELAAMKRDGFVSSHPLTEPVPPAQLPKVVNAAIAALQADGPILRHLQGQAWELLNGGMEASEVAQRIANGEDVPL